jgi:hypothetical protein
MTSVLHVTYMQLLKAHSTPACAAGSEIYAVRDEPAALL